MGFSAHTAFIPHASLAPAGHSAEQKPYIAPSTSNDAMRISELSFTNDRPKSKDYSQLFGKPGSVLFGNGTRDVGGRGLLGGLDGSTWVPPNMDTPVRAGKRKEGDVEVAGMGYFVFPPGGSPSNTNSSKANLGVASASTSASSVPASTSFASPSQRTPPKSQKTSIPTQPSQFQPSPHHPRSSPSQPLNIDSDLDSWDNHLSALHNTRLAREALEAQKGEEYWVSCGGVLRDAQGRRDLERTRKVREELELREREGKLLEMWEEYEKRWAGMVRKVRGVKDKAKGKAKEGVEGKDPDGMLGVEEHTVYIKFHDIPWPVHAAFCAPPQSSSPPSKPSLSFKSSPSVSSPYPPSPESILAQLTPANIRAFLLDPLAVRGSKVSPRERIRSSILRWHPDKMGSVVEKVEEEEETDLVVRGVGEVARALQGLMAEVARERNGENGA